MRFAYPCTIVRDEMEHKLIASFIRPDDEPDNLILAGVIGADGVFPVTGDEIETITEMARDNEADWQIVETPAAPAAESPMGN